MKRISYILSLFAVIAMLGSCELLPLQTNEKSEGKAIDPYTGLSCLEFIQYIQDDNGSFLLSNMYKAIQLCGIEDLYSQEQPERTYLLLDNTLITQDHLDQAANDPEALAKLKDKLLFHIIQGNYHSYGTLSYESRAVVTMYDTSDYIVSLALVKSANRYNEGRLDVTLKNVKTNASSTASVRSSCYFLTNGVGHIMAKAVITF